MKRIYDILFTIPGLMVLSPLFVLLALWIKLDSPGPIFYRQTRIGRDGMPFRIIKFRTMVVDADRLGSLLTLPGDSRITRCGHWLRQYKLDELPQLVNVIKGEMSLVGPRPEVPAFVNLYSPSQRAVLKLRPGITDPASIKYRNETEMLAALACDYNSKIVEDIYVNEFMADKIEINLVYAAKANFWSDIKVIVDTILVR